MSYKRNYRYVIFDFDGTICKLVIDWVNLKSAISYQFGLNSGKLMEMINHVYSNANIEEIKKLNSLIATFEQPNGISSYSDFNAELLNVRSKLFVVSNNLTSTVEYVLRKEDVMNRVCMVIGIDKMKKSKPDPNSFSLILKVTNDKNKSDYLYVGDTEIDKKYAEYCGIDFCHIDDYYEK